METIAAVAAEIVGTSGNTAQQGRRAIKETGMKVRRAQIYNRFLALCSPAPRLKDWPAVPMHEDVRLVGEPVRLVAELGKVFPAAELCAARIVVRDGQTLQLNLKLLTDDGYVLPVRDGLGKTCDLLTSQGLLRGDVPLLACSEDETIRTMRRGCPYLYVVASLQEVILLRSLGIPATTVAQLHRLNAAGLVRLLCVVDGDSTGGLEKASPAPNGIEIDPSYRLGPVEDQPASFYVVLVAARLTQFSTEAPAEIVAAAGYLAQAEKFARLKWFDLAVWFSSDEEFQRLAFLRRLGNMKLLRNFFCDHDGANFFGVQELADPAHRPSREISWWQQLDVVVAAENRARHECSATRTEQAQEQRRRYEALVDEQVYRPLMQTAEEEHDSALRELRHEFALCKRMYWLALPDIQISTAAAGGIISEEHQKLLRHFTSETTRLLRELKRHERQGGPAAQAWFGRRRGASHA